MHATAASACCPRTYAASDHKRESLLPAPALGEFQWGEDPARPRLRLAVSAVSQLTHSRPGISR